MLTFKVSGQDALVKMKIIKPSKSKKQDDEPTSHELSFEGSKPHLLKLEVALDNQWQTTRGFNKKDLAHKKNETQRVTPYKEKLGVELNVKDYSGSDIDIFADDESWDKVEYSRTNTDLGRFKKKSKRSITTATDDSDKESSKGLGREKINAGFVKSGFSKPKRKKAKKSEVKYEESAPLVNGKKRRRSELENTQGPSALEQLIDSDKKEFNSVLSRGMRLLAIREHSVLEIRNKLVDKFADYEDVDASLVYAVVDELVKLDYVSDDRFAESYVRSRANKGFGPVKIKAELKGKGVSNGLIQDHLKEGAGSWFDKAEQQYIKKYGDGSITDYNTWTKRARFMQSRGFTMEHIHVTLPKVEFD